MEKIRDFGAKIGGARKDMYSSAKAGKLDNYNDSQLYSAVREDFWPAITKKDEPDDWLRFWKQKMRLETPKKPIFCIDKTARDTVSEYFEKGEKFREKVMNVHNEDDINAFYKEIDSLSSSDAKNTYNVTYSSVFRSQFYLDTWKDQCAKKAQKTERKKGKRRKRFVPEQLKNLKRVGPDWRGGRNVTEADWMNTLGFRAGEFGNWLSQNDRQESMNMAYDSFMDMAYILGITPDSLSFGRLAIAFGSRGHGSALAHYEPANEVIALTKMKGAGSLAHETFHAIDNICAKLGGVYGRMSTQQNRPQPIEFYDLVSVMIFKDKSGKPSDFYRNSALFDRAYLSADNGYWRSYCEMAARAFACYITDRLADKGMRNDYLSGHSELAVSGDIAAIPQGAERTRINAAFDALFKALKKADILHAANPESLLPKKPEINETDESSDDFTFRVEASGQLSFF